MSATTAVRFLIGDLQDLSMPKKISFADTNVSMIIDLSNKG